MNRDIIIVLAREAGFSSKHTNDKQLEKFAQLIVAQCMNLVKDCYAEPGRSLYQSVCASTIIEEHFGVEE